MSYPVDRKAQIHSELALLMPRLAAFAAALTGSEAASHSLVKATRSQVLARAARERGHTPLVLWAFSMMYALWASKMKAAPQGEKAFPADARLFQPRSSAQSAEGSAIVRMAKFIAQLPPSHRATLHLVYGERLSYDEVGEVLSIPVATVISRLARAYSALIQREDQGSSASAAVGSARNSVEERPRGREWAA